MPSVRQQVNLQLLRFRLIILTNFIAEHRY